MDILNDKNDKYKLLRDKAKKVAHNETDNYSKGILGFLN